MKNIFLRFRFLIYPLLLLAIEGILFVRNFKSGTFLVGWDNIMPEFNLKLNFLRSLTAVWQDYRGLGTLDGMAHAANLFHTLYIAILSIFLSENVVRYAYIHGTHLIGGLAFYFLALKLLKNKTTAFFGALVYMLNIGVIQMYYAPLEVFATHFASLPVMALAILNALEKRNKKSLVILFLASLLTTPQGFVPTVFIAYAILAFLLIAFSLKKAPAKRILLIISVLFITNAFWLLPFGYSALTKSDEIKNTRINEFSSEEIYYRNKDHGTIQDVLTFKGFMLDTVEFDAIKDENVNFMGGWVSYVASVPFQTYSFILALLGLFGIILSFRYKIKQLYPFVAATAISFFFLANNTPVLLQLNELLRNIFPVFGEAFRFPFTKFVTLFAFGFSIFIALGVGFFIRIAVNFINDTVEKFFILSKKFGKALYIVIFSLFIAGIFALSKPAFDGYFTSPYLKLSIPNDYKETTKYFSEQNKDQRILTFPLNSFWNWEYRSWGHRGSGFLWYGIEQPLLSRAFDPWSNYNEQLYNEFSDAFIREDVALFDKLLEKYDISYILVDEFVINTLSAQPTNYDKIAEFLKKSTYLKEDKRFGKIVVYKKPNSTSKVYSLNAPTTLKVSPTFAQNYQDPFVQYGNYVVNDKNPDVTTPLASLSTLKLQDKNEFEWQYTPDSLSFSKELSVAKNNTLTLPSLFSHEFLIPVEVSFESNLVKITPLYPNVKLNGKTVSIPQEPILIYTQIVSSPTKISFNDIKHEVLIGKNSKSFLINNFVNTVTISDGVNDEYFEIDTQAIPRNSTTLNLDEDIQSIEVTVPLFDTILGKGDYVQTNNYVLTKASDRLKLKTTTPSSKVTKNEKGIQLEVKNDTISADIYLNTLFHQGSYAVIANTTFNTGLPLNFYVDDPAAGRSVLETKFAKNKDENIVILPSIDNYGKGYGFHFGVKSVNSDKSITNINDINIYPIPLDTINKIRFINNQLIDKTLNSSTKNKEDYASFLNTIYTIKSTENNKIITLSNSFDKGWAAYIVRDNNKISSFLPFIFGKRLDEHVKVNNWANGWEVKPEETKDKDIVIVYLPLYLEYIGFTLLALMISTVLLRPIFPIIARQLNNINTYFEDKSFNMKQKVFILLNK